MKTQKELQFSLINGKHINTVIEDDLSARDYFDMIEKNINMGKPLKLTDYKGEISFIRAELVIHFYARPSRARWYAGEVD